MKRSIKHNLITLATLSLFSSGASWAAGDTTVQPIRDTQMGTPATTAATERARWSDAQRAQLEQKLRSGQTRADYARILEDNGYRIAAINADEKDYLEYEVVKGTFSFEVQLDFDNGATRATEIAVTNNLWRADATERMLANATYMPPAPLVVDPEGRYSDRRYILGWTSEKQRLQKALPPNLPLARYKPAIEEMGYKVTAVNYREPDYVEYEIAKGTNSYEVQIDVDPRSRTAAHVEVTANLWEADATERAIDKAKN